MFALLPDQRERIAAADVLRQPGDGGPKQLQGEDSSSAIRHLIRFDRLKLKTPEDQTELLSRLSSQPHYDSHVPCNHGAQASDMQLWILSVHT